MLAEHWATIAAISGVNIATLLLGIINITSRLTRIETDVKWIKRGCPKCQETKKGE